MSFAAITRIGAKISAKIVKHAPEILTYGGLGAMTASVGFTAIKTTSYEKKVLKPEFERLDTIALVRADSDAGKLTEPYTEIEERSDRIKVYLSIGLKTIRHYTVPLALLVGGAACVIAGHNMISKRLAATAAAYATMQTAYINLRKRVSENIKDEEVGDLVKGTLVSIDEDGNHTLRKDLNPYPYQYYFDMNNPGYHSTSNAANLLTLQSVYNWANDRLWAQGHVFLNEVLERLGMEHTPEGAVTGWVLNNKEGDSVVSFGECDVYDVAINAHKSDMKEYTLNFNVDGLIWDKI